MRFRFRDKLVLAFALLLLVTVVPVLVLVNAQIEAISVREIEQQLRNTGRVFQRFQLDQLATNSERATSFILTQPEVRAEIATAGSGEQGFASTPGAASGGDPFGAAGAAPGQVFGASSGSGTAGGTGGAASAGSDPFGAAAATPGQVFGAGAGSGAGGAAPGGGDPFGATAAAPGQVFGAEGGSAAAPVFPGSVGGPAQPAQAEPQAHPAEPPAHLTERQTLLLSVMDEVALFRDSAVFFLTDFRGTLIFNKADPRRVGSGLVHVPAVRTALAGNEVFTWWGTLGGEPVALGLLPAEGDAPRLYQMFLKPVVFGGEVKGLIGIGFPFGEAELAYVIGITQAEVAFLADAHVYVNSLPQVAGAQLLGLAAAPGLGLGAGPTLDPGGGHAAQSGSEPEALAANALAADTVQRFDDGGEEYLALRLPVTSTLGEPVGTVLVYRSKTEEERVFVALRRVLNGIGLAALVVAAVLAFGISASVSRVVRQLFAGVSAVREGDLDVRLDIRSRDEFGELGRAFNEMTAGLKEKEQIRSTFKRYVSSSVVDELLRSGDSVALGGESKQLTIQFSDIAGFTSLSESLSPQQVVEFLNAYLSRMTAEVEAQQGIVDKYIGDAVMAFWGAPIPQPDHADRACRAALGQLRRVAELRAGWAERGALARFSVRLGLHSGEVVVGNIGSDTRMDYTIIGDSVNTASRLEGMNKVYGTHILVSEDTVNLLHGRYTLRELDRILVVGKSRPVRIYELAGEDGELPAPTLAIHARFAEGLVAYRDRRFDEAAATFSALAQSGDAPAGTFLRRCEAFQRTPPPEDWNGVYVSESK